MFQFISKTLKEYLGETLYKKLSDSIPWIGFIFAIGVLFVIVNSIQCPAWLNNLSKFLIGGVSAAFFTRWLGGMGMYRNAISDVLGEDRWLDRRNDLDDLWRRITRRIFLPGFDEDARGADDLLLNLNSNMTSLISKPTLIHSYYAENVTRKIHIFWQDENKRLVRVEDDLRATIVPFRNGKPCTYSMMFTATTGESIENYDIRIVQVEIDGDPKNIDEFPFRLEGDKKISEIKINKTQEIRRIIHTTQNIDDDPVFMIAAGRVILRMSLTVYNRTNNSIRVNFEEFGVDGAFRLIPKGPSVDGREEYEWEMDSALLPDQGIMMVMAQKSLRPEQGGVLPARSPGSPLE